MNGNEWKFTAQKNQINEKKLIILSLLQQKITRTITYTILPNSSSTKALNDT